MQKDCWYPSIHFCPITCVGQKMNSNICYLSLLFLPSGRWKIRERKSSFNNQRSSLSIQGRGDRCPPLDSGNEAQDIRENSRYPLAGKTSSTGLGTRLFFFRRLENCNNWAPKHASKTNSAYLVRKELSSRERPRNVMSFVSSPTPLLFGRNTNPPIR